MKHEYFPQGICPMKLDFELDGDVVKNIEFTGGCNGNLKGICALAVGKPAAEIKQTLKGITCGSKDTSCPDQLAAALEQMGY